MEHGNLSNTPVPKAAFRFEEIIRRNSDGRLNRTGKAFLENLAHLDVQVILLTTGDERRVQSYCYKWGVYHNRVHSVDSILELIELVRELNVVAFWDTDDWILQKIKERAPKGLEVNRWISQGNLYQES